MSEISRPAQTPLPDIAIASDEYHHHHHHHHSPFTILFRMDRQCAPCAALSALRDTRNERPERKTTRRDERKRNTKQPIESTAKGEWI